MKPCQKKYSLILLACITASSFAQQVNPRFENSVVSHNIDLIRSDDPTVIHSIEYVGTGRREMPDKRNDELFDQNSYVFKLAYRDRESLEIWAHSDFSDAQAATGYVELIANAVGKLPKAMRHKLDHIVLHKGNETAFAEHLGHFFVLYSDNVSIRFENNDLEETVFHESVHATLDYIVSNDIGWKKAQTKDLAYITEYAQKYSFKEDLAESAIFAFSLSLASDRLPADLKQWLETNTPHRLNYLDRLFTELN